MYVPQARGGSVRRASTLRTSRITDHDKAQSVDPIWVTVAGACRMAGVGRSLIYKLLANGTLFSTKVGGRRLVSVASIEALGGEARP